MRFEAKVMHHLNWNGMYGFWLVARSGSFAEAARRLPSTTAQALHKRVRQLEWEQGLHLKLLRSRGVKGIELTEAGQRLLELVDPMFGGLSALTADLRKEDAGPMSLAATGFVANNYLPQVMKEFRRTYPSVVVSIRVQSESDVIAAACSGEVDLGIGALAGNQDGLTVAARAPLAIRLVGPVPFQWGGTRMTWSEVLRYPLVVHDRVSVLRVGLEQLLNRRSLLGKLTIAAEVTTPELVLEMVRAGFGVGLIPLGPRLAQSVKDMPLAAPPEGLPRIDIAVFHKRHRYLSRYMKALVDTVAQAIAE
ncbi:MAG: LysR family transcriptional regulator [Bryobacterales bacterium]|nr:LysR family transcriptional regulator [Bryobacterales bacterium]